MEPEVIYNSTENYDGLQNNNEFHYGVQNGTDIEFDQQNDESIQYTILALLWLAYAWKFYLILRQLNFLKATVKIPEKLSCCWSLEKFNYSRRFIIRKNFLSLVYATCVLLQCTVEIYFGLFYKYWRWASILYASDDEVVQSCFWIMILITIYFILELPFSYYNTCLLERRYGFNKKTNNKFLKDELTSYLTMQFFFIPSSGIIVYIINHIGNYFFLWLWITTICIILVLMSIYPSYIEPIFDSHIPFPEGELRKSIERITNDYNFPVSEIYMVACSKKIGHSDVQLISSVVENRVILYSSLFPQGTKEGLKNDEILAIVAHELGHRYHKHYMKLFYVLSFYYLTIFLVFYYFFKMNVFYTSIGFPMYVKPKLVGLVAVMCYCLAPYNVFVSYWKNKYTRSMEYEADRFAVELNMSDPLKRAIIKLNENVRIYCFFDQMYSCWNIDHPTLPERLAAIRIYEEIISD